jgi:hypothetical protein
MYNGVGGGGGLGQKARLSAGGRDRVRVNGILNQGVTSRKVDAGSWPYARFKALQGRSSMLMWLLAAGANRRSYGLVDADAG